MTTESKRGIAPRLGIGLIALLVGALAGWLIATRTAGTGTETAGATAAAATKKEPLYWVAPMDPNYRRDRPGKSPMGMDLVPVYEEPGGAADMVRIEPAVENNLGVRSEPVRVRPLWRRIEAPAYVGFDETLISHISVRTQGWITRLNINANGERVRKGELLFELYSPELVNAQKEYLQARRRGDQRLIAGAEEKLRALGMIRSEIESLADTGQVSENIRVVAPQDGVISDLNVREGMFIQPNTTTMGLADLSSVWLQAGVFESQAEWVAAGQAAKATLEYLPGYEFNGQVDYVYPILDPETRTLRVRLRFDNPDEQLKPNMYAQVSIYGKLHPNALSIPRSALIRGSDRNRVVVALGEGRFRVHEVLTGMESGDFVEIIAGVEEGDQIVTSAQFLLDSEASLAGAVRRLEPLPAPQPERQPDPVLTSGQVEAVDVSRRRIRVSHGPIDELAWPAMIMEFKVLEGVSLEGLQAGQEIRFMLQQQHAGEYAIAQLSAAGDDQQLTVQTGAEAEVPPGRERQRQVGNHEHVQPVAEGAGVIRAIDRAAHALRIAHDPIRTLDWPAMTMMFAVGEAVSFTGLEVGQHIRFVLSRREDQTYVIEHLSVVERGEEPDEAGRDGAHDHD